MGFLEDWIIPLKIFTGLCFFFVVLLLRWASVRELAVVVWRWAIATCRWQVGAATGEVERFVQEQLGKRRGYFAEGAAFLCILDTMLSGHATCVSGGLGFSVCLLAFSFMFVLLRSWHRWRGPWTVRMYVLSCTVLSYAAFVYFPGSVLLRMLQMRREILIRFLFSMSCAPLEATFGHAIYVIARMALIFVVKPDDISSELCSVSLWRGMTLVDRHGNSDVIKELLREMDASFATFPAFVRVEIEIAVGTTLLLLFANVLMSYDLDRTARLQTSEAQLDAFSQMLANFCDATSLLAHDFVIERPSPGLAFLLNIRAGSGAFHRSSFCERISTEEDRHKFVSLLSVANNSKQEFPVEPCRLTLKDAFSLDVPVMLFYACFLGLDGSPRYLVGMNELSNRHQSLDVVPPLPQRSIEPRSIDATSSSCMEETDSEGTDLQMPNKPEVVLCRKGNHFEVHSTNEAFDTRMGRIIRGYRLERLFPIEADWRAVDKALARAEELTRTRGQPHEGLMGRSFTVQAIALHNREEQIQEHKVRVQIRTAPPQTGLDEFQVTLFLIPCRSPRLQCSRSGTSQASPSQQSGSSRHRYSCSAVGGVMAAAKMHPHEGGASPAVSMCAIGCVSRDTEEMAAPEATLMGSTSSL